MTQVRRPPSTWREIPGGIWALGLVSLFMDISSEMIHALLPLYLVGVFGASTLTVGFIEGTAEATAAITKVFSGAISDYLGNRKWLTALGYGLSAATKPIFPLATSIAAVTAARFIDRLGKGIRDAPRDALVADLTPKRVRGSAYGLRQSLDAFGAVVGPLLAIVFMAAFADNFRQVFWVAVVPAFISLVIMVFGVREPKRDVQAHKVQNPFSRAELVRLPRSFWLVIGVAAVFTLARFSDAFLVLRAQAAGMPLAIVPAVMIVMNLAFTASSWPAGMLSDQIGRYALLVAGFTLLVGADLLLAFGESISVVMFSVALWGLHMGLTQGLLAAMVADAAPAELRGTAFGLLNLVSGLALFAASIIAGGLWQELGPRGTFLAGAGFSALALALLSIARHWVGQASEVALPRA